MSIETIVASTDPMPEAEKVEVHITGKKNGKKGKHHPNLAAIEQGALIPPCAWCGANADINDGAVKVTYNGESEWMCKACRVRDEEGELGEPLPMHPDLAPPPALPPLLQLTVNPDGTKTLTPVADASLVPLGATETIEEAMGGDMTKREAEEAIKRITDRLSRLEKEERKYANFFLSSEEAIRRDVIEIYRRKGWIALGLKSFTEIGHKYFSKHQAHLYRLKDAALVEERLRNDPEVGPVVAGHTLPERQLRELRSIPVEKQPLVFKKALEEVSQPGKPLNVDALTGEMLKAVGKPYKKSSKAPVAGTASDVPSQDTVVGEDGKPLHKYLTNLWYDEEDKSMVMNFKVQTQVFAVRISLQEMIEAGLPAALFG